MAFSEAVCSSCISKGKVAFVWYVHARAKGVMLLHARVLERGALIRPDATLIAESTSRGIPPFLRRHPCDILAENKGG